MLESKISINGESYGLLLNTKATKDIAKRYGGLEKLGDKLLQSENFEMAIDEVIWLIVELANQYIKTQMLKTKTEIPLLTEEEVEILTSPSDLADFKDAIMLCLQEGMSRSVHSEQDEKNKTAG